MEYLVSLPEQEHGLNAYYDYELLPFVEFIELMHKIMNNSHMYYAHVYVVD